MNRTTRAVIAFAFGSAATFSGLAIAPLRGKVQGVFHDAFGVYLNADSLGQVGAALLVGGLVIQGLALLGWIIAPRDDR